MQNILQDPKKHPKNYYVLPAGVGGLNSEFVARMMTSFGRHEFLLLFFCVFGGVMQPLHSSPLWGPREGLVPFDCVVQEIGLTEKFFPLLFPFSFLRDEFHQFYAHQFHGVWQI